MAIGLILLMSACNSDRPESASVHLAEAELQLSIIRTATHPFLARYRLVLQVQGHESCRATAELFPDTGYAGRRNLYQRGSDTFIILGQYDARVIKMSDCSVQLVEFQSLTDRGTFLGSFDTDEQKRWGYVPASVRRERQFERH